MVSFLEAVRRGWRVLILVTVPLLAGVVAYTETRPDEFESVAVVSFAPRSEREVGADVVRIVLPKYQVYAESEQTVDRVAQDLGVDPDEIQRSLEVSIPLETSNVRIVVGNERPRFAAGVANAIAQEVESFSDDDQLLEGSEVAPAKVPDEPSGPPRRLLEIAGGIASLLAGIGVMLAVDRLRPVLRTASDVGAATKLRILGVIPRTRALRAPRQAIGSAQVGSAIRNLRTQLDRITRHEKLTTGGGIVLAVTSSVEAEGKSSIAALYASASALVKPDRVVLIDADLLRPDIARLFKLPPRPGVAEILRGEPGAEPHSCLRDGGIANLAILPTGPDRDAGDVVARSVGELLRWASSVFDLVVIDTPPVLGNDIGPTIATHADGVVFVVRRGTRAQLVEDAVATLQGLEANLLGVVANGTAASDVGYYA